MPKVVGHATGPASTKQPMLLEALQDALNNAPPPPPHSDIQHFTLLLVQLEHGGFVNNTTTLVTLDVQPGPLSRPKTQRPRSPKGR
jgi:hypothetical protein